MQPKPYLLHMHPDIKRMCTYNWFKVSSRKFVHTLREPSGKYWIVLPSRRRGKDRGLYRGWLENGQGWSQQIAAEANTDIVMTADGEGDLRESKISTARKISEDDEVPNNDEVSQGDEATEVKRSKDPNDDSRPKRNSEGKRQRSPDPRLGNRLEILRNAVAKEEEEGPLEERV